jgi:hypothetical protein
MNLTSMAPLLAVRVMRGLLAALKPSPGCSLRPLVVAPS